MDISPIATQSVQHIHRTEGDRTEITQRRYQDIGGKIVVQDVDYYVYNRSAEVEHEHRPQVDLHV